VCGDPFHERRSPSRRRSRRLDGEELAEELQRLSVIGRHHDGAGAFVASTVASTVMSISLVKAGPARTFLPPWTTDDYRH